MLALGGSGMAPIIRRRCPQSEPFKRPGRRQDVPIGLIIALASTGLTICRRLPPSFDRSMEGRWLFLARIYEFTDGLSSLSNELDRQPERT